MPTYTSSISIAANAAPVWQALSDVVRWPEWLPTVTAVEALDAPALATGRRFRIVQPRLRPAVWTVSALNPPLAFAWTSASPGLRVRAEHTVEAVAPGQVRVTLCIAFSGFLAPLVGRLAGPLTREYLDKEAAALKRRVESGAAWNP